MLRLVAYLVPVVVLAWALSWLADRPGSVLINPRSGLPVWHGYASTEEGYDWDYGAGDAAWPDSQPHQDLK